MIAVVVLEFWGCGSGSGMFNPGLFRVGLIKMLIYSWIGRPVRTHKKSICRETKRATTDLNIWMKSSRRGTSNGGVQKFIFSFFGELFLKDKENIPYFLHGT